MRKIRLIDRGGFGTVHEFEAAGGTRVACKLFDPHPQIGSAADREKLKLRFAREVRVQSQIRHPNIMPVLDHDLEASPPWFTMPLATASFFDKLEADRRQGTFDPAPWQDILAAVEELHRLGFVHRDLKPQNILLVENTWMLSDFGLILPMARDTTVLTSTGSAYGSPGYAAPEQAQDFRHTPEQADIFALGCILHDAVDHVPHRVPYAQIRIGGIYGPLLEKCTETNYTRRFPSVAALRAALFDLWRTSEFATPARNDAGFLDSVLANPNSSDAWRKFIGHLETLTLTDRSPLLRAVNSDLLVQLAALDDVLFGRLIGVLCAWVEGSAFNFEYCDVIGDRLVEAYRISPIRVRCEIVLAALELAVSHNRWHVMGQVGAMLDSATDNGLIDRLLIEIGLESDIAQKLRRVEKVIYWSRDRWHPKIAALLNREDGEQTSVA